MALISSSFPKLPQAQSKDLPIYFKLKKTQKNQNLPAILCGIFIVVVVVIVVIVVVSNQGAGKCSLVELGTEIRPETGSYVGVVFSACPSEAAFAAFVAAAARWSQVVAQSKITAFTLGETVNARTVCGTEKNAVFSADLVIDHLIVVAETVDIDGAGGVLARAGPCLASPGPLFPFLGIMQFDNADLATLEADGTILQVITHEMGHVLGLGTLWEQMPQGGGKFVSNPPQGSLLPEPVYDPNTGALNANRDSRDFVPVEDDGGGRFNVFNGEGKGSIDGHWDISTFGQELMVFAIDANTPEHPLSKVSIASLQDLGYIVNLNEADSYQLPGRTKIEAVGVRLRGAENDAVVHKLIDDIYRAPATALAFNKAMKARLAASPVPL